MVKFIFSIALVFIVISIAAKEPKDTITIELSEQTRNIIYSDVQYWLIGGSVNMSYERVVKTRKSGYLSLKGTYGRWLFWDSGGDLFKLSSNLLYGQGSSQMEVGFGASMLLNVDQYNESKRKWEGVHFLPDVYLGYRYKKPQGHFIFKAGIGFPGLLTFGLGAAF